MHRKWRWTKTEEKFIIDNHETMTDEEIGRKLRRTRIAVRNRKVKLREQGSIAPLVYKEWTEEMDNYLIENIHDKHITEIMEALDMTIFRTKTRIIELGLDKEAEKERKDEVAYEKLLAARSGVNTKIKDLKPKNIDRSKRYLITMTINQDTRKIKKYFEGVVIQETERHITLKDQRTGIRESFLKVDFLTQEYNIKGVN